MSDPLVAWLAANGLTSNAIGFNSLASIYEEGGFVPEVANGKSTLSPLERFKRAVRMVIVINRLSDGHLKGHKYDIDGQRIPDAVSLKAMSDVGLDYSYSADGLQSVKSKRFQPIQLTEGCTSTSAWGGEVQQNKKPVLDAHFRSLRRIPSGNKPTLEHSRSWRGVSMSPGLKSATASHTSISIHSYRSGRISGSGGSFRAPPPPQSCSDMTILWIEDYCSKMKGVGDAPLNIPPYPEMLLTFFGVFATLLLLCALTTFVSPHMDNCGFVIVSFGATAVLVYCVPESKLCQPRNFLAGQLIGAVIGVAIRLAFDGSSSYWTFLAGPLATAIAILLMQLTRTTHPPGGGTALAIGLMPTLSNVAAGLLIATVCLGSVIFLLLGIIINNLSPKRRFPTFWFGSKF